MYLSRVELAYRDLPPAMLIKLEQQGIYAVHQWLWQLFPQQTERNFLFQQEQSPTGRRFYLLSAQPPAPHNIMQVVSKPFAPQLHQGDRLCFSLRANPVITRHGKRSDVLMDAKYHTRATLCTDTLWQHQCQAALMWLQRQGQQHGFMFNEHDVMVEGYQQHRLSKPQSRQRISYSSVDFKGLLTVDDPALFVRALSQGLGKSRGLGCGLMLIKRAV